MQRDRALIIGINQYADPSANLRYCVQDATSVAESIVSLYGFDPRGIRMLVDRRATATNIRARLAWLVENARPGDKRLLYYSGHGTQVATRVLGEVDGLDEALCPHDFDWDKALIRDKEIAKALGTLPRGASAYVVLDSCHSGDMDKGKAARKGRFYPMPADIAWRNRLTKPRNASPIPASAVLLSACADNETAAEVDGGGAFTLALLRALRKEPKTPLTQLLAPLRSALKEHGQSPQLSGAKALCALPLFGA